MGGSVYSSALRQESKLTANSMFARKGNVGRVLPVVTRNLPGALPGTRSRRFWVELAQNHEMIDSHNLERDLRKKPVSHPALSRTSVAALGRTVR